MKPLALIVSYLLIAVSLGGELEDCKCFQDFQAVKEGDRVFCRGNKNHRGFECNEEAPPICTCEKRSGQTVTLDLGELHCISYENEYKSRRCEPLAEWRQYFRKYPERNIHYG